MLEANLDDATGEQLAHALRALLEAGAHDAWITPVVMKKGRPGHTVHVLADPSLSEPLRDVLRTTTGTFGVRVLHGERWPTARTIDPVDVSGFPVRVKVGGGRAKPEFEDVVRVATETGLSIAEVSSRAEQAWRQRTDTDERGADVHPSNADEPA